MHHVAWVIAPLVLAVVLAWSGVAKLGQGASLRSIISSLRLPAWLLPAPLARAMPAVELVLAVTLLAPWLPAFAVAAVASCALLVVYWLLIARGLTISPRPVCGCFGRAGDHQISRRTLWRNTILVLMGTASAGLALSGRTVWSALDRAGSGDWLWLGLAALACLLTRLVLAPSPAAPDPTHVPTPPRPRTEPGPVAPDGPADDDYVRVPTPSVTLHDPKRAAPVTLHEISRVRAQLLVFVNCYCHSTKQVMAQLGDWDARIDLVDVRMVFSVPIAEKFVGTPPSSTLLDHSGLVWTALGLTASPSAVLLGVDGYLAGGPVAGTEDVWAFVDEVDQALREVPRPLEQPAAEPAAPDARALTSDR